MPLAASAMASIFASAADGLSMALRYAASLVSSSRPSTRSVYDTGMVTLVVLSPLTDSPVMTIGLFGAQRSRS